jgi:hypothetical protein
MEGSGSSSSQVVAQMGLTLEEFPEGGLQGIKLAVTLMNLPVLTLT